MSCKEKEWFDTRCYKLKKIARELSRLKHEAHVTLRCTQFTRTDLGSIRKSHSTRQKKIAHVDNAMETVPSL